jgi:hypothetical protein
MSPCKTHQSGGRWVGVASQYAGNRIPTEAGFFVEPLPEPLGCQSVGSKRGIIFAVGVLSFGRTWRCTVASHSGGYHAVYSRTPLWIPRLIFEPFRQWDAPFVFRRERFLVSQPPTPWA